MNNKFIFVSLSLLSVLLFSGAFAQLANASGSAPPLSSPSIVGDSQVITTNFHPFAQGHVLTNGLVKKVATTHITLTPPPIAETTLNPSTISNAKTSPPRIGGQAVAPAASPAVKIPLVPQIDTIMNNGGSVLSAKGVNAFDNYVVNGVDYEPPDQGLCVGNGYVIDVVNTVLRIYTTSFQSISADISPNQIDGLPLSAFTSDPRCLYDQQTGHWFLTQLFINFNSPGQGFEYIAVSKTQTPLGYWNVYALNVTDSFPKHESFSGQTSDPGCPCFGDQPLLGASRDALAVSTNEFNVFNSTYDGAQVYLFDKLGMALGSNIVSYVHLNTFYLHTPDGNCPSSQGVFCWASVNPAASPDPSQFDNSNGGTEYALSTLDFQATGDDRLALWSFSNTQSLHSSSPDVTYSVLVASGLERYVDPFDSNGNGFLAPQKEGLTPAGATVYSHHPNKPTYGCKGICAEGLIQSNGDQMFDTVVYAQGALWGAVNTIVHEEGSNSIYAGIAYWIVNAKSNVYSVADQGYIAARSEDVLFPSIGVGPTGVGVMTFTLTGTGYYPSTAFGLVNKTSHGLIGSSINVADLGLAPYDATSEYQCVSGTCKPSSGLSYFPRWGDYTWAVWSNGRVYFSTEYIQYKSCTISQYNANPICSDTRGPLANWGTSLNALST